MKWSLIVNGIEDRIEVLTLGPDCRFRLGDAAEREASVEVPQAGMYSILLDGRSYDARVEERPGGELVVVIDGYRFEIEISDPRRWSRKSGSGGGQGVQSISTPMPGKVVRVLISPGDAVEAGQGLVVVEAMKMQNELKASRAGKVLTVAAKEGATVAAFEVLATIE